MELEETILSEVTQSQKEKTWYLITHRCFLDIDLRITTLQSTSPEKLASKKDSKRDTHGPWEKGKGTRSPEQIGSMGGGERELGE